MAWKDIEKKRAYQKWWSKNLMTEEAKEKKRAYDRVRDKLPYRRKKVYKWKTKNKEYILEYYRKRNKRIYVKYRLQAIDHYSSGKNCCECCGEDRIEFMSIDHINNDGNKHRKEYRGKYSSIGEFLVKNNFPEGFRVLCYNCNLSLGFNKYCPHNNENNQ